MSEKMSTIVIKLSKVQRVNYDIPDIPVSLSVITDSPIVEGLRAIVR